MVIQSCVPSFWTRPSSASPTSGARPFGFVYAATNSHIRSRRCHAAAGTVRPAFSSSRKPVRNSFQHQAVIRRRRLDVNAVGIDLRFESRATGSARRVSSQRAPSGVSRNSTPMKDQADRRRSGSDCR